MRERVKSLPSWVFQRMVVIPPYTQQGIDFYVTKLAKLRLCDFTHPLALEELRHCQEVLASVDRMREMERSMRTLHDHKNPPII